MNKSANHRSHIEQLCKQMPTQLNINQAISALIRTHDIQSNKRQKLTPSLLRNPFQVSSLPNIKEPLESVYGKDHSLHAFRNDYDWGVRLTEPAVTKTLVNLLDHQTPAIRNARLAAFLHALNCPDMPENLSAAIIRSEHERIDILVGIPLQSQGDPKYRPIIIEAKFGHVVTRGQLETHSSIIAHDPIFDHRQADRILILLNEKDYQKSTDGHVWRFVLWRDLWKAFEKNRPSNDPDISIALFMNGLWKRIGE